MLIRSHSRTVTSTYKPFVLRAEVTLGVVSFGWVEVESKDVYQVLPMVSGSTWHYPENTVENLYSAMGGRQLRDNGLILDRQKIPEFMAFAREFVKYLPVLYKDIASHEDWLASREYSASKKQRSLRGMLAYETSGRLSTVRTAMIKREFNNKAVDAYPRLICMRSPAVIAAFGPVVQAMTRKIKKWMDGVASPFVWTSGLSQEDIALKIHEAAERLSGKVWYGENDYTLYDSSQNPTLLAAEALVYEHMLSKSRGDPRVIDFLADHYKTMGEWRINASTKNGGEVEATVVGTRSTGDANTTLGNTIVNFMLMCYAICKTRNLCLSDFMENRLSPCTLLCAGDDSLLIANSWVNALQVESIQALGVLCDYHATCVLSEAEFCSLWFAYGADSSGNRALIPMKKWGKLFTKTALTVANQRLLKVEYYHNLAVQKCEALMNLFHMLPAIARFYARVRKLHLKKLSPKLLCKRSKLDLARLEEVPFYYFSECKYKLTSESYDAIFERYGLLCGDMVDLYHYLDKNPGHIDLEHPTLRSIVERDCFCDDEDYVDSSRIISCA